MKATMLRMYVPVLLAGMMAGCARDSGCTDPSAINYDAEVTTDDGSCVYPQAGPQLSLRFVSKLGDAPFAFDTDVLNWEGRRMRFTMAQCYMSGIRFGTKDFDTTYLFVSPDRPLHPVGTLEAGTYDGLRFRVGVDSAANHADPAIWPSSHVLSSNNIFHSHWGWDPGYVFIRVEGLVDTTAAKNGQADAPFVFHIGTDDFLRTVYLDRQWAVDSDLTVHVRVDWLRLFAGMDLRADRSSHTTNDYPTAQAFIGNLPAVFTLE